MPDAFVTIKSMLSPWFTEAVFTVSLVCDPVLARDAVMDVFTPFTRTV